MNIMDRSAGIRDGNVSSGPASGTFNDELWEDLTEMIGSAFFFSVDQIAILRKHPVLKLVAALYRRLERISHYHGGGIIDPENPSGFWDI